MTVVISIAMELTESWRRWASGCPCRSLSSLIMLMDVGRPILTEDRTTARAEHLRLYTEKVSQALASHWSLCFLLVGV